MTPSLNQRLAVRARPPGRPAVMFQTWQALLFLHWEIDPDAVQKTLPAGLTVDTFEGRAYLGVIPFYMHAVRPRFCPPVPGVSYFLETNVRTYVHDDAGRPGVWFYSLDANRRLAVFLARTFFKLPYYFARMTASKKVSSASYSVDYTTKRAGDPVVSRFAYAGTGPVRHAEPGSLEFFLAERYLLFAHDPDQDQLFAGQVFHTPYPLQDAQIDHASDHLIGVAGFDLPHRPADHALFSAGVSVDVFAIEKVWR